MAISRSALALVVVTSLASGCTFGTPVRRMPQATTALGASVAAEADRDYAGELLWVREDGVVVLTDARRVVLIRWNAADKIEVKSLKIVLNGRVGPTRDHLQRLRLSSRHPYGLTEAQIREVLARYQQTELEVAQR